jgi:carbon storage regulator
MLVLSRQRDESIMIGDKVVITIVDIRGDKVRLGIEAPQEVPVHRQEVYEAIKREGRISTGGKNREEQAATSNGSTKSEGSV